MNPEGAVATGVVGHVVTALIEIVHGVTLRFQPVIAIGSSQSKPFRSAASVRSMRQRSFEHRIVIARFFVYSLPIFLIVGNDPQNGHGSNWQEVFTASPCERYQ